MMELLFGKELPRTAIRQPFSLMEKRYALLCKRSDRSSPRVCHNFDASSRYASSRAATLLPVLSHISSTFSLPSSKLIPCPFMIRRLIIYNYILLVLSIAFSLLILRDILRLTERIPKLLKNDTLAHETWVTAVVIWLLTCIGAPITSIWNMHSNRIRRSDHSPCILSLFKLHMSRRWWHAHSASHVMKVIEKAQCYEEGTSIQWSDVDFLTASDKLYVTRLVEDFIYLEQTDQGPIIFVEKTAWLPLFCGLFMSSLFFLSALWAFVEVVGDSETGENVSSFALGKTLAEWVSNFVLLIFGLGEIVTRGSIFSAFQGLYPGSVASMTPIQRESMVALYIAISAKRIEGLMQRGCYAPIEMTGSKWMAPPVNSALLASIDKFDLIQHENKWLIAWNRHTKENGFTVRTVAYSCTCYS